MRLGTLAGEWWSGPTGNLQVGPDVFPSQLTCLDSHHEAGHGLSLDACDAWSGPSTRPRPFWCGDAGLVGVFVDLGDLLLGRGFQQSARSMRLPERMNYRRVGRGVLRVPWCTTI